MDLGKRIESPVGAQTAPGAPERSNVSYPSFTLSDDQASAFLEEHSYDVGDTCTASVKLKVTSKQDGQFGPSLGFDVISLDHKPEGAGNEEVDASQEATVPDADHTAGQEGETPAATGEEENA